MITYPITVAASVCVALLIVMSCMFCQNPEQMGEYWPEEPDYSDEYMYHTARRDHTRVFHQKKQYPQNILYKVALLDVCNTNTVHGDQYFRLYSSLLT